MKDFQLLLFGKLSILACIDHKNFLNTIQIIRLIKLNCLDSWNYIIIVSQINVDIWINQAHW